MGRCITIITLGGVTSLGLLTGSLVYESFQSIPDLIRSLNNQDFVHSSEGRSLAKRIKTHLSITNVVNLALAALSTSAFRTAYKYSGASGKHPYLIYSALGAPLALLALFYKGGKPLMPITDDVKAYCDEMKAKKSKKSKKKDAAPAVTPAAPAASEPEALDSSYVNISESSSSSESSPVTPEGSSLSNSAYSIEEEVENALRKKERVHELNNIQSAFSIASYIAGAAFAISSVGFVGDRYFI